MKTSSKILIAALLIPVFLFATYVNFSNLGSGTPSEEKERQIFASKEEIEKWAPEIIKLRENYYSGIEEMLNPEKPFKETYEKIFLVQKKIQPLAPLPQEQVLDRIRGYLIGVFNSDEQNTMRALSRLNPLKGKFNPGVETFYGGFYYYSCGAALAAGKLFGWISLNPDLTFYFFHPEETRRMYMLIRSVGALSVLLTAGLIFFRLYPAYDLKMTFLSLLFFVTIPLLVPYSQMAKAHNFGMFLFFLGFCLFWRTVTNPSMANYAAGALVLGCSAGSIITNLSVGITIFMVEWFRNGWSLTALFKNKKFWVACLIFFLVYFATNWYIFANFGGFKRMLLALKEYMSGYGETYGEVRLLQWIPFFKDMFTNQFHWTVLPLLVTGCITALVKKDSFIRVSLYIFSFLFIMNLLFTRHPGINIRIFPLIAILTAAGCSTLLELQSKTLKVLCGIYICVALSLSGLQTYFYSTLLRSPNNLLLAGEWVNSNIPKGETIGVIGGQFSQSGFPPFHFLDYRLINLPRNSMEIQSQKKNLPAYVLTNNESDGPMLNSQYQLVKSWGRPKKFLNIPFKSQWVITGNTDFFVFRKV